MNKKVSTKGYFYTFVDTFYPVFLNETPESVLGNIHQQLLFV